MPEIGTSEGHHTTHEKGGADEVSLAGLTLPAHGPTHEKDGADEIDATGLQGIPTPTIKFLTFTGDGTGTRAITGVGFQPSMVFLYNLAMIEAVKASTGPTQLWDTIENIWRAAYEEERVLSLDSDGFTIEDRRNLEGTDYQAICIK